ncbi:MAG TPA: hypothetical protein VK034_19635 [Enhygromyxa sp.]|nr:hypothetical protein [Enhygromyxa sp.]
MRNNPPTPTRLLSLVCVAALAIGCSDDTPSGEGANETTAASGTAADTESSGAMDTTETPPTTDDNTDDPGETASFVNDEAPTGMEEGGLGNLGEQCQSDADCVDDLFCNGVPGFGGICSECASDSDCPEGSNCTFLGAYFGCGDGSQGQMCESDESCGDGLHCAEVVDLGGLFNGNFCSECAADTDCPEGQLCAPQIEFMDLMNISGQRACIEPDTAPNGQLCDAEGSGDEQCEGFCTVADVMGFLEVGVCGECETDTDCDVGTCMPAMVGFDGFAGSTCG